MHSTITRPDRLFGRQVTSTHTFFNGLTVFLSLAMILVAILLPFLNNVSGQIFWPIQLVLLGMILICNACQARSNFALSILIYHQNMR